MAWTKAKTAIVVTIAAILAVGTTATLIVQHPHQVAATPNYFPRSSWKNAGYADPISALETALWATTRSDGQMILDSLSPDLQQGLEQQAKRGRISPVVYLSRPNNSAKHLDGVTAFHLIQSEPVSDNEVRLHLSIEGKADEQVFTMKKDGNDWKLAAFPSGF